MPTLFGALPLLVFLPVTSWFNRRIRRQLREARGRLCTHCAYNVGPLGDAGICPECGQRFDAVIDEAIWSKIGYRSERRGWPRRFVHRRGLIHV